MSLMDRINFFKIEKSSYKNFIPVKINLERIGSIHIEMADFLHNNIKNMELKKDFFSIPSLEECELNNLMEEAAYLLEKKNVIRPLSNELFPCVPFFGGKQYFVLDRAALPIFGVTGYGVHLNGYVSKPDGPHIWVPKRSLDRYVDPGKLDNTVAGGIPAGESVVSALVRECKEEANIGINILKNVKPVGAINYILQEGFGLRPDVIFTYDLNMQEDFIPKCSDGEIEKFELLNWKDIYSLLSYTEKFKANCSLVLIDFFIRHGLLEPDKEQDYEILATSIRSSNHFA